MKIAPMARAFDNCPDKIEYKIVHTGQHYDTNMSDVFFQELGIRHPDYHLGAGGGSHATPTPKIMTGFEDICMKDRPDLVIVVGDVNSTLACSIVAKKLCIKVAHVEAGLGSFDLAMPEEINRMVTDAISDLFFVTEAQGLENLLKEGKPQDKVHFVGHVMIDNLYFQLEKLKSMTAQFPTSVFKKSHKEYGVVTLHRPSNVDTQETLEAIFNTLSKISERLLLFFPVHPKIRKNKVSVSCTATLCPQWLH